MPGFTLRPSSDGMGFDVILASGKPVKSLQSRSPSDLSNVAVALCYVAGVSHFAENTMHPAFDVGRKVMLSRARIPDHSEAITVLDENHELQAGWLPEWAARHSPSGVFPRRALIVRTEPFEYGGTGRALRILYGSDLDTSWPAIPLDELIALQASERSCADCGAHIPASTASCPLCGTPIVP